MKRIVSTTTIATTAILATLVGGSVLAATQVSQSSDEQALAPTRPPASRGIEQKVDALLGRMTTKEKLQQVQLLSDGQITDAEAKAGVGGVFSLTDPAQINHYQHVAVEQSRLHIPILFAYDTIHGYRTIFPVPLGAASSFDPDVARTDATIGARESATVGLKQVYSPMVDVSHEPRWGRIVEGAGEDPYLGSVMGAARVKGAQGSSYSARDKVVSSVKHYVAYGQPEGGRDYNTTDMSESAAAQPLPAAVQGRDRRRRGHGDVLVQLASTGCRGARTSTPRPRSSRSSGASTGSSRATTRRWPRPGPARRGRPTRARAATAPPPTARRPAPTR